MIVPDLSRRCEGATLGRSHIRDTARVPGAVSLLLCPDSGFGCEGAHHFPQLHVHEPSNSRRI
jgi:hypothetical protein